MKILLNAYTSSDLDFYGWNQYPLGLLSIAEYVNQRDTSVEFKVIYGELDMDDVEAFGPDMIGISVMSPYFTMMKNFLLELRKTQPDLPVIVGGHHVTYLPSNLPETCNVGVCGEGEVVFHDLVKMLQKHGSFPHHELEGLHGVLYWGPDGEMVDQQERPNFMPPTDIPVITNYDICTFKIDRPIRYHVITSRGCPYRCTFCSSSPFWGKIRYQGSADVVDQLEYIIDERGADHVHMFDDLMILNKKRLREVRDILQERGLNERASFECWVAGSHFDDETVDILKAINVSLVGVAVESGSPEVYNYLKGKWNTPEKNAAAMRRAAAAGMNINISVIVGSPVEKEEDLVATYEYLKQVPFDGGACFVLKAFPGTPSWDEAREKGHVSDDMEDWLMVNSDDLDNPNTVFLAEHVDRDTVKKYQVKINKLIKRRSLEYKLKKLKSPSAVLGFLKRRAKELIVA